MYRIFFPLTVDGVIERSIYRWMDKYGYEFENGAISFIVNSEDLLSFNILFAHPGLKVEKIKND